MLSLCAVLCGAEDFEDIAIYGKQKEAFLRRFLSLPNGIPSHDTINRVFNRLDKEKFANCLYNWSRELLGVLEHYQLAIDGKVLRATATPGKRNSGISLVSAWAQEQRLVLGQQRVEGKSNEKTAIPALLEGLDLKGAVVSIDAIACQSSIAEQILTGGGDYLLALKNNNKFLYEQGSEHMLQRLGQLEKHEWVDFGRGRIERRVCYVCKELTLLDGLDTWPGIRCVVMIKAGREKQGQLSEQTRFYLSSLEADAQTFNLLVRNHWGIENHLHWMLDVYFAEDRCRTHKGNGADNMATLRKMALQVLNRQTDKESIKSRRKMAGWIDDYLLEMIQNIKF